MLLTFEDIRFWKILWEDRTCQSKGMSSTCQFYTSSAHEYHQSNGLPSDLLMSTNRRPFYNKPIAHRIPFMVFLFSMQRGRAVDGPLSCILTFYLISVVNFMTTGITKADMVKSKSATLHTTQTKCKI
uniref:Uncharacterized protein n=1 Tax=Glossina pallidipes TaxID=7398 RepID=A0A1B0ACL2_GLOPL